MIKGPYLAKQDTTFEVDTEWECVKVYLIRRSHFAIPGRDGPVILEQRHRSCLLTRVNTPVKQSKLIEKPATTSNE